MRLADVAILLACGCRRIQKRRASPLGVIDWEKVEIGHIQPNHHQQHIERELPGTAKKSETLTQQHTRRLGKKLFMSLRPRAAETILHDA